jgi:hypothetical protein
MTATLSGKPKRGDGVMTATLSGKPKRVTA